MINRLLCKINYYWRIFATGVCFTFFGIGGAFLGCIVFPMLRLFMSDSEHRKHRAQYIIHLSFRLFVTMMGRFGLLTYQFKGFDTPNTAQDC